jgi:hypothetical protein
MFHRHHDANGAQSKPGPGQQWEKTIGNVVDKRLLPAQNPPHPKIFGVQLHPAGREPLRAEVHVSSTSPCQRSRALVSDRDN